MQWWQRLGSGNQGKSSYPRGWCYVLRKKPIFKYNCDNKDALLIYLHRARVFFCAFHTLGMFRIQSVAIAAILSILGDQAYADRPSPCQKFVTQSTSRQLGANDIYNPFEKICKEPYC